MNGTFMEQDLIIEKRRNLSRLATQGYERRVALETTSDEPVRFVKRLDMHTLLSRFARLEAPLHHHPVHR